MPAGHTELWRQGSLDGDAEVELLCELWALGVISARTLQRIGAAAMVTAPCPQMQALAGLGTAGEFENNITRDLKRKLHLSELLLPKPFQITVPMWDPALSPARVVSRAISMILPHEHLASPGTTHVSAPNALHTSHPTHLTTSPSKHDRRQQAASNNKDML